MKANLDKNLAPAWVSGKSYSTGEFCLYNKRLYICTTDNSDAEFDNSKWERRNLVDLVSGINSNLISDYVTIFKCGISVDTGDITCTSTKKIFVVATQIYNIGTTSLTKNGESVSLTKLGQTSDNRNYLYAEIECKKDDIIRYKCADTGQNVYEQSVVVLY